MKINYVTGNEEKFHIALKAFQDTGIELIQRKIHTPEIQHTEVSEIAKFSARYAWKQLKEPVIVNDAGFYFTGLNGFPGPFIKYINQWLKTEDILKLLEGKSDRGIIVKDCLAYCSAEGIVKVFENERRGTVAESVRNYEGTMVEQLMIPENMSLTLSELSYEEQVEFWSGNHNLMALVKELSNKQF